MTDSTGVFKEIVGLLHQVIMDELYKPKITKIRRYTFILFHENKNSKWLKQIPTLNILSRINWLHISFQFDIFVYVSSINIMLEITKKEIITGLQ